VKKEKCNKKDGGPVGKGERKVENRSIERQRSGVKPIGEKSTETDNRSEG